MVTYIKMPQKGLSEESAILNKWYVKKGDTVKEGDYLFTIETGKATFDIETEASGTVLETIGSEGDEIVVKSVVCVIGNKGDLYTIEEIKEKQPEQEEFAPRSEDKTHMEMGTCIKAAPTDVDIIRISPRARALADKKGIDIRLIKPSGPKGRIIEQDIRAMFETGHLVTSESVPYASGEDNPTALGNRNTTCGKESVPAQVAHAAVIEEENEFEIVPNSTIRKIIAQNMLRSIQSMAQLTMNTSFDATEILAYRDSVKAICEKIGLANITINDIIIFSVSRTITNFLNLNAHYDDIQMKLFKNVHIGIAVDTNRGLMVPTLFNANKKSLNEVSKEARMLISQCQEGAISPQLLTGATITITNMGAFGIESFTPIINPPQTAILGIGSIEYKAKMVKGQIIHYPAMGLSLTIDHRAVDGAPAARFLKVLNENLENFSLLLSK